MTLAKYPVTSPSGAQYRVTIREEAIVENPEYVIDGYAVRVYERRESGFLHRLFPWRRVWCETYMFGFANRYEKPLVGLAEETVRRYESRPQFNVEQQFLEWDGVMR